MLLLQLHVVFVFQILLLSSNLSETILELLLQVRDHLGYVGFVLKFTKFFHYGETAVF